MAVMFCWKTGLINIGTVAQQPEGTVLIATGLESKLRSEMLATATHHLDDNTWYVPGVAELVDQDNEDAKYALVVAYSNRLLARRFRHKGRVVHNSDE